MKKLTSAALLSLALLLSACGKPGESTPADTSAEATDSTAISSDSGTEESSVEEETLAQKVKKLFTTLATTNNGTYVSAGYFTEYHYEGGMFHLRDSSVRTSYWGYGEAKIANYGIAQFGYTNDTMGVDADMCYIVSPNTNISYSDYNHILADLGESGKNIEFTEASRSHTFSTTDAEFIQSLCDLDGLGIDGIADEFTTIRAFFNLTDDGKGFEKIGYSLKGSQSRKYKDIEYANCSLTDIGTTKINAKVDAYLKTNPTFTAPTAWDAETTAYIAENAPGLTLPFPSGVSYASSMPLNESNGIIFSDLGSGNKNTAYGQALVAAGFTLNEASSSAADNFFVYTKVIAPAQGVHLAKTAYVGIGYEAATGDDAIIYPNGVWYIRFQVAEESGLVENVTLADVNAEFAAHKLLSNKNASILPTLTLTAGYTQIDYLDLSEDYAEELMYYIYQNYGQVITPSYCYSAEVHVHYASEADADAAIANLKTQVLAAGYENATNTSGQPIEGYYTSEADAASYAGLEFTITKVMTKDDVPAYDGMIAFSISHYAL